MNLPKINPWLKTTLVATLGGGIAGATAALMDPTKYSFPHDLGSGKLWKFFIQGALMVGGATLIKSPLGQKVIAEYKESQQTLKDGEQTIIETKTLLKEPASTLEVKEK